MASNWKPLMLVFSLLALFAWLAPATPGGWGQASADPSLQTPRLSSEFVAMHEDHDDEDHGEEDEHDGHGADGHEDDGHEDEWDENDEEWEEEHEHMEREHFHLELQRAQLQAMFGELEIVSEIYEIVEDADKTATLAIVMTVEEIDDPEMAAEFLRDLYGKSQSDTVRRLIRLQLAEVYGNMGKPLKALGEVTKIVAGE